MLNLEKNVNKSVNINGYTDDVGIANEYAKHFSSVYYCSSDDCESAKNFPHNTEVRISDSGMLDYKCLNNMTVELIDLCLSNMRKGKACGPDNLCAEHLLYAHPSLVMHLKHLYVLILQHGFVPNSFGCGVGVLLVKDKMGNLNDIDNYRGITLSPIISNLFEMSRLEICNDIFSTD